MTEASRGAFTASAAGMASTAATTRAPIRAGRRGDGALDLARDRDRRLGHVLEWTARCAVLAVLGVSRALAVDARDDLYRAGHGAAIGWRSGTASMIWLAGTRAEVERGRGVAHTGWIHRRPSNHRLRTQCRVCCGHAAVCASIGEMTEAELYRAVLADPTRNEPRLAYAAGIERKDPDRARFIRLQIEEVESLDKPRLSVSGAFFQVDVSRAPGVRKDMEDFLARVQGQGSEIADRFRAIDALLERNKKRWTPRLPAAVTDARFFRGFVDLVEIPAPAFLAFADELYAAAPIRHVDFTGSHGWMDRLTTSPALSRLVAISFAKNRLDDDDIAMLASSSQLGSLQWLDLTSNQVTIRGLETIATSHLRDLDYIEFWNNQCDNPVDRPAWDPLVPSFMSDIAHTDLGQDLERRFGPQHWLHSPERHPYYYSPARSTYY